GLVYILRWYWWRINAWSEISAMIASFVFFVALTAGNVFDPTDTEDAALLTLVITILTTEVWIAVTYVTRPAPEETLIAFYRRVRPGGIGWRRVAATAGFPHEPIAGGALSWVNWLAGVVSVYATLFGVGKILFGSPLEAIAYLLVAAVAFAWIGWSLRHVEPERRTPVAQPPAKVAVPAGR
ncbi:MAG: sodium:solute symporter family protein, partial [Longimicrobiales bacterium]